MILAIDVDYREHEAVAAGVAFRYWMDSTPSVTLTTTVSPIEAYEPGAFYKRELPCLQAVIKEYNKICSIPITCIIVDGYVWLTKDKPGLGHKLFEILPDKIPVIGVAKTSYKETDATPVYRGDSKIPLHISSDGMDVSLAAKLVQNMHGDFRLPTLLKLVDQTCRK